MVVPDLFIRKESENCYFCINLHSGKILLLNRTSSILLRFIRRRSDGITVEELKKLKIFSNKNDVMNFCSSMINNGFLSHKII